MAYDIIVGRDISDKKIFGERGLVYLGKGYVKMGQYTSLSNKIFMDVARSHVILVAGKRGCLDGNTLVFTDSGYKKIREFNGNKDKVLSFDKERNKFEWENAKLLRYSIEGEEELLKIELEDKRKIILTKEHPLLAVTGENLLSLQWINAKDLKENNKLTSVKNSFKDIEPISIKKISKVHGIKEVYDLSVNKNHSFIANGIISHNSGKSYTLGVIAEELSNLPKEASQNIGALIFDTMGIYWTMKIKNEKDKELLEEWGLKPKNLPVKVFVPFGHYEFYIEKRIPIDDVFALDVTEMQPEDWVLTFGLNLIDPVAVLIQRTITKLKDVRSYDLNDILYLLERDEQTSKEVKNAAIGLFEAANTWGVFAKKDASIKPTKVEDLVNAGTTTVLDLSVYNAVGAFNIRALVISLISRKIFNQRMSARKAEEIDSVTRGLEYSSSEIKRDNPLVWIFIDEAHEFLPLNGKTVATDALIQLLREGRQPGISVVLATQQPGQIHHDVMTQSDIVIAHRVTSKPDVEALNYIMQSYILESIKKQMDDLPSLKGSAILLDDNSERIYPMRIRPRFTWHGGEAPTAVKAEKRL